MTETPPEDDFTPYPLEWTDDTETSVSEASANGAHFVVADFGGNYVELSVRDDGGQLDAFRVFQEANGVQDAKAWAAIYAAEPEESEDGLDRSTRTQSRWSATHGNHRPA